MKERHLLQALVETDHDPFLLRPRPLSSREAVQRFYSRRAWQSDVDSVASSLRRLHAARLARKPLLGVDLGTEVAS